MQQPRIWLVEDEQSIADTLVYMLQQEGFQVSVFGRGLPALEGRRIRRQMSPSSTSACRISAASSSVGVC